MTHKRLDVSDLTRIMATTTTSIGRLLAPNKDYNSKAIKYSYQGKKTLMVRFVRLLQTDVLLADT